jgi:hypothetical protein
MNWVDSSLEFHFVEADFLSFFWLAYHTEIFAGIQNKTFWTNSTSKLDVTLDGDVWNFSWLAIYYLYAFLLSWPANSNRMVFIIKFLPGFDCL